MISIMESVNFDLNWWQYSVPNTVQIKIFKEHSKKLFCTLIVPVEKFSFYEIKWQFYKIKI